MGNTDGRRHTEEESFVFGEDDVTIRNYEKRLIGGVGQARVIATVIIVMNYAYDARICIRRNVVGALMELQRLISKATTSTRNFSHFYVAPTCRN